MNRHHSPGRAAAAATAMAVAALLLAGAGGTARAGAAPIPYTFVDPGTLGGAQSFMNLPGSPTTKSGALIGTADTAVADSDYPNFNPFVVGLPDPFTAHAFAWRNGRMTDLGALPGNNSSAVFQVNGDGVGAGMSETGAVDPTTGYPAEHAVLFASGKTRDLGTLPGGTESQAVAINDRGQAAGFGNNGIPDPYSFFAQGGWTTQTRGFVWQKGAMKDLGSLGGPDTVVTGINSRGQIFGVSFTDSTPNDTTGVPTLHPYVWEAGRMRDLGTLGGTYSEANAMNEAGQIVGLTSLEGDTTGHPYLWDGRRLNDLGTLGGDFGDALAVNDAGHATGFSTRADGTYHAFLWANGKMRDLPPPAGFLCAAGFAINMQDDIVGTAQDCQGNNLAPVIWHKGVPYDLSTLVAPTEFVLDEPEYIDDRGVIVGHGFLGDEAREFMLVPGTHAWSEPFVARASRQGAKSHLVASTHPAGLPTALCDRLPAKLAAAHCARPTVPRTRKR